MTWSREDFLIVRAVEVTPPGYEDVVQKLKTKPEIDNPWAVAWSMKGKEESQQLPEGELEKFLKELEDRLGHYDKYQKSKAKGGTPEKNAAKAVAI